MSRTALAVVLSLAAHAAAALAVSALPRLMLPGVLFVDLEHEAAPPASPSTGGSPAAADPPAASHPAVAARPTPRPPLTAPPTSRRVEPRADGAPEPVPSEPPPALTEPPAVAPPPSPPPAQSTVPSPSVLALAPAAELPPSSRRAGSDAGRELAGARSGEAASAADAPGGTRPSTVEAGPDAGGGADSVQRAWRGSAASESAVGSGGEVAVAVPSDGAAGDDSGYLAMLGARIKQLLRYPLAARRRGLSGIVELEITLRPNGAIGDVRVAVSSSHAMLDDAAVSAARAIGRVPVPAGLASRPLRLPVVFKLE